MLQGLRTATYPIFDPEKSPEEALAAARDWYAAALDYPPYFDEPFYVGFDVSGYELGLMPVRAAPASPEPDGATVYWGVEDADAAVERLVAHGASAFEAVQDVGEGIRLGTVLDPFGNVLGVIYNPHFRLPSAERA